MDSELKLKSPQLDRISFLAQPKRSKTVWATTPWELTWGNQESIRPLSRAALQAVPSPRIQALAQPKRDFTFHIQLRTEEEERRLKMWRPSSHAARYDIITRLANPRSPRRSAQEVISPHSVLCDHDCPVWHVSPSARNAIASPRILHLANPKPLHPDFTTGRQSVQSRVSSSAQMGRTPPRLTQLALPRLRQNTHIYESGPPESPIRPVSRGARKATASERIRGLSAPKAVSKDYLPPRAAAWPS